MDQIIDFSNCKRAFASFGGSDRKFGVVYNGEVYMLKFSDQHAKRQDISTSYVNNTISEYISSHIAATMGLPVHETVLGLYNDEVVVGCKDFRSSDNVSNMEFSEFVRASYDSHDIHHVIQLNQIYNALNDPTNAIPLQLQKDSIQRYWDTFVLDALVGNFDRHIGNWGYLVQNSQLSLAPIYDLGSTLFPQASDQGVNDFIKSEFEMTKRTLVFPSPALMITDQKVGKVGYYDMLSSNYDSNCTASVLRIAPKIDMDAIKNVIDHTPLITDVRKDFYKKIVDLRNDLIIQRAYVRCAYQEYDQDALQRLTTGHQFSTSDLEAFLVEKNNAIERFRHNEEQLKIAYSPEYVTDVFFYGNDYIDKDALIQEQRDLMERFGFHSDFVELPDPVSRDIDLDIGGEESL